MGRMIDDDIKQQLLDALAKEPPMVISTAYAYAKNYVNYGEDITKAWTTAVQQASILEKARQQGQAVAYEGFKADNEQLRAYITMMQADYNVRLKDDMVAMLEEIQSEIQKFSGCSCSCSDGIIDDIDDIIQQKIDALKEDK